MAAPVTTSTSRLKYFAKICLASQQVFPELLQELLVIKKPHSTLHLDVSRNPYLSRALTADERSKISNAGTHGYINFDISLSYKLIRYLNLVPPPSKGWGHIVDPAPSELTIGDDVERIRRIRNRIIHRGNSYVSFQEFKDHFDLFRDIARRLEIYLGKPKDEFVNTFDEIENYSMDSLSNEAPFPSIADTVQFRVLLIRGTYKSYNNRVYLAGACNVGKSTIASNLIGENILLTWNSTDGLVIYFGRNGIDLEKKEMVPLKHGPHDNTILSKVLRGKPTMDQLAMDTNTKQAGPSSSQPSSLKQSAQRYVGSKDRLHGTSAKTHRPLLDHQNVHDSIMEEIRKGEYKVLIAPSDLVDFGGQRIFDLTHQLFIQQKGAFVLILDGRKDLDDILPEYDGKMTTREILLHWVNSILTYCFSDDDDIYPVIVFAATHSDELSQEEEHSKSKVLTSQLYEMFSTHEHEKRIRYQEVFFINATDRNDKGVEILKNYLVNVAFQQKSWGENIPMAWVPLELQIAEIQKADSFIIKYDQLDEINKKNDDLSLPDPQLKHFLRCQHSLGRLMYFDMRALDQFIIVKPTAMVDILRSFITDEIFWPKESTLCNILNTASTSGIINKCDLFKLWSQEEFNKYVPTDEIKEYVIQVLVHLDILVQLKRFNKENKDEDLTDTFIVPCIIRQSLPNYLLPYNLDNNKSIILSYRLLKSAIPHALAYKLIGAVLNIWPLKRKEGRLCLFDKAAVLEIDQSNDLYLTFRENQLVVVLSNTKLNAYISPEIASIIQECLTLTMNNVLEFYFRNSGTLTSSTDISNLFVIEVGEKCGEDICFVPFSEVQDRLSWTCKHKQLHSFKYPKYWVFGQKQERCAVDCTGLDTEALNDVPEDRHLIRLAEVIGQRYFYDFIIHLGLTKDDWDEIKDDRAHENRLTRKFVGLCEWRKQKLARNISPTFEILSKALADIQCSDHYLCRIFRERYTEVFTIDNPKLQETPDDTVLQELSRNIGYHTLHLGVELGLDMISIEETQYRYLKDMFAQTYEILIKWKTGCRVKPTVRALMLALQYVDPRGFHFLQKQYDVKQKKSDES